MVIPREWGSVRPKVKRRKGKQEEPGEYEEKL